MPALTLVGAAAATLFIPPVDPPATTRLDGASVQLRVASAGQKVNWLLLGLETQRQFGPLYAGPLTQYDAGILRLSVYLNNDPQGEGPPAYHGYRPDCCENML
jgi:hypothetical protein